MEAGDWGRLRVTVSGRVEMVSSHIRTEMGWGVAGLGIRLLIKGELSGRRQGRDWLARWPLGQAAQHLPAGCRSIGPEARSAG